MMSFRLSSEAAGSGFPEKSSGDADNATDPKSPRDTPCGSRDKWQNKTHILSFNPALKRRADNEKGFTLVELLVVVIILGILAAIAVPIYLNQRKSAWNGSTESDVKNASLVVESAGTTNGGKYNGLKLTSDEAGATQIDQCEYKSSLASMPPCYIAGNKINLTKGVTLKFTFNENDYKIEGTNDNAAGLKTYTYNSATGNISHN